MKDSVPELNVSSSETEEDKEEAKPDGEKDPDFNQVRVEAAFHRPTLRFSGSSHSRPLGVCRYPAWDVVSSTPLLDLFSSLLVAGSSGPDFFQNPRISVTSWHNGSASDSKIPELVYLLLLSKTG